MKSAYELAMARLEKNAPAAKVSDAQRLELAEIDGLYRAKIAEREVFLRSQIQVARAKGDPAEVEEFETQLARDLRRLQAECEEKKQVVRERPEK